MSKLGNGPLLEHGPLIECLLYLPDSDEKFETTGAEGNGAVGRGLVPVSMGSSLGTTRSSGLMEAEPSSIPVAMVTGRVGGG